ncbi:protein of unknown function [Legionella fallonii LLAP-10]|uniref:Uncharacterized protein n=1 Tax=Legionella fallonii LLAP-10 TaxID=1212491 RepID=A0A098FZ86_9GAMM|nr:protein of unknown function [Legionella fallonii LLAP-10]
MPHILTLLTNKLTSISDKKVTDFGTVRADFLFLIRNINLMLGKPRANGPAYIVCSQF